MRSIDFFDRGHDQGPDRPCIVEGDTSLSFAEVKGRTEQIARALYASGFENQQKIALFGPNSAELMVAMLAIYRANGIWIGINTRNAVDANIQFLNYVEADWIFYHSSKAKDLDEFRAQCPSLKRFVCVDQPCGDDPSMDDFAKGFERGDFTPPNMDVFGNADDIVGLAATGGTTGPSKGVVVTNNSWGNMLHGMVGVLDGRTNDPKTLVTAPITHAAGPVSMATLAFGATQVILPGFDADAVLDTIETHGITHMYLPPTAMYMLLDHPKRANTDTSSLEIFILVGSPVSPARLAEAVEAFGPCMCQSYGQVECPMIVTWLSPEHVAEAVANPDLAHRLASCGREGYGARVGIMAEDGSLQPVGEVGEIVTRGPLVSPEYYLKPEATAEARVHGWHHTGDVGYRDKEGFIYIVDRKKDMVITGGFNVFSAEVEAAITELPQVRSAAVFGIPDEKWGEQVHAAVIADGISADAIISHAKERLGGVKAPKSIEFLEEIPITPNGKMDKKQLRAPYWNSDRMVN